MLEGFAEVALGKLSEVDHELGRDRLVKAGAGDEGVTDLVGRPLAEHGTAWVARDDPRQREHDEHDPEQDRDRHQQPAQDELGHVSGSTAGAIVEWGEDMRTGRPWDAPFSGRWSPKAQLGGGGLR